MAIPFAQKLSQYLLTGPASRQNMQQAVDRQRAESDAYRRGDITQTELGLRTAGNVADASVGNMMGQLMQPAMSAAGAVIPDAVSDPVVSAVGEGVSYMQENYPRASRNLGAALSVSDAVLPIKGASMARQAGMAVDELTGAESGRGMLTASANNVIPGYYGSNRGLSIASWLPDQIVNTAKDIVSPSSRAKYREQGINQSSQKIMARARARDTMKDSWTQFPVIKQIMDKFGPERLETGEHRGIAQGQYLGRIHAQSGRKGKSDFVDEIMRRSDLIDAFEYYPGSYVDMVKGSKLKPYPLDPQGKKKKMPVRMSDDDLVFIEDHFSSVWKEPSAVNPSVDVPFKESEGALLAIKNPAAGSALTGGHFKDVMISAPYVKNVRAIFKGKEEVSSDELFSKMNAAAEASQQLKEPKHRFSVVGKAKDGGVWISGSRPGSAITEGGINYLTKITPDGKMVGVMSDEHNLFEGIAAKTEKYTVGSIPALSMIKHLLPKRLIAVTPPMVRDIKSESKPKAEKQRYEHPSPEKDKEKRTYVQLLDEMIDYKPSKEVLAAERKRNVGGMLIGAGLTSAAAKDEEEQ
jgi:hypothetical protein